MRIVATVDARDPRDGRTRDTWELSANSSHELLVTAIQARVGLRHGSMTQPDTTELADAADALRGELAEDYWALGLWLADVVANGGRTRLL